MTTVVAIAACVALIWGSLRYAWWRRKVADTMPRVLMYHMIAVSVPRARFNKLRVHPKSFERQIKWLRDDGWTFILVSDLLQRCAPKSVAITFDDGYLDNYTRVHAILEKYDAKATLYLVVDRHGRDWSAYKKPSHRDGELGREDKLTDEHVRTMLDSGRWELGAHTETHAYLPGLPDELKREEIAGSKRRLTETFSAVVNSFAYPFGPYDPGDVDLVREAGFTTAVTTEPGITSDITNTPFELKRIKVSGKDNMLAFVLRMRTGFRGLWG